MSELNRKRCVYLSYILVALLVAALAVLPGCAAQQKPDTGSTASTGATAPEYYQRGTVNNADQAKSLLTEGNNRYVSGKVLNDDLSAAKREVLAKGQKPFAVILTCSDSRVPPELLFDQGLGDIFIIRTAGNVVDPIAMGSVEYGVDHLKAPLLVVMGHSKCGAVKATVDGSELPGSIPAIAAKIKPSVDKVKAGGAAGDDLYAKSEDANVKAVMAELEKSPVVKELVEKKELTIVGAKYDVTTGQVTWFEEGK